MDNEIESLYVALGLSLDDPSVEQNVDKMLTKIKQKIKSSIYGNEKGVITLPATIEGKYKNGKDIEKEIVDAYTAIYDKAKEMADKSVSLTLEDIQELKKQINKFSSGTRSKRGNDTIANANNNLTQLLTNYQEFVNDLRKQASEQQKLMKKQLNEQKKLQNSKTPGKSTRSRGKSKYNDVMPSKEEIKHAEQVANNTYYNKTGITDYVKLLKQKTQWKMSSSAWGNMNSDLARESDRGGPYGSSMLRQMMKSWVWDQKHPAPVHTRKIAGYIRPEETLEQKVDRSQRQIQAAPTQAFNQMQKASSKLMKGKDGAKDLLMDAITNFIAKNLAATPFRDIDKALEKSINSIKSGNLKRFDSTGFLGIDYGDKDTDTPGEGPNIKEWNAVMSEVLPKLSELLNNQDLKSTFDQVREPLFNDLSLIRKEMDNLNEKLKDTQKIISENNAKAISSTDYLANLNQSLAKAKEQASKTKDELKNAYIRRHDIAQERPQNEVNFSSYEKWLEKLRDKAERATKTWRRTAEGIERFSEAKSELDITDPLQALIRRNMDRAFPYFYKIKQQKKDEGSRSYAKYYKYNDDYNSMLYRRRNFERNRGELADNIYRLKSNKSNLEKEIAKISYRIANTPKSELEKMDNIAKAFKEENKGWENIANQLEEKLKEWKELELATKAELYSPDQYKPVLDVLKRILTNSDNIEEVSKNNKEDLNDTIQGKPVFNFGNNEEITTLTDTIHSISQLLSEVLNSMRLSRLSISELKNSFKDLPKNIHIHQGTTKSTRRKKQEDSFTEEELNKSLLPTLYQHMDPEKGWTTAGVETKSVYDVIKGITASEQEELNNEAKELKKLNSINKAKNKTKKQNPVPHEKVDQSEPIPKIIIPEEPLSKPVEKSKIYASPIELSVWDKLSSALEKLTGTTNKYNDILNKSANEQDQLAAERIHTWGLNNGRNPNDTGDVANIKRALELFRTDKKSIVSNPELMQNIKLTSGVDVDTTKVLETFAKTMSGKAMRNAQMGGGPLNQIGGFFRGFIGMPSIEKSRALADGLNQMLQNTSDALQSVLTNIQSKETELSGLESRGDIQFDAQGNVTKGTSAAKKVLADLEEEKLVLETILADQAANDEIIKTSHGDYRKLIKTMSYASPVLRDNNNILRNLNAGLDKTGKALKFQSRTAEILNYTSQLMSRSIGQMFKQWLSMIHPINIIKNGIKGIVSLIKNSFNDFASYDVKWKRTMNVIKLNLQTILRPFMEWIAQKLVNVIGFIDIISMKIQKSLGRVPISLFDQSAADAEKMRRELEEAANVSAGFDELHDIGSDNSAENDLLGDIYKPQLSQEWIDLANKIGDLFGHIIKGDLGFGEVMKLILQILGDTLGKIGQMIWEWFKNTSLGKFITEHWKGILATILAIFLGWKLLKIAGPMLFKALFGKLTQGSISGVFSKIGDWIVNILGSSGLGQGITTAFQTLFAGGKYSVIGTLKEMFTNSAAITEAKSWGSMIGFAITKALVGTISIALGGKMLSDAVDSAKDKTSYNVGLEQNGGNAKDKKGIGGDVLKGAGGGALIGFGVGQFIPVIGPAIGAAIGGIAGALTTALAPAFEKSAINARELNNELQKTEYYEGMVQGAQSQVDVFQEQLNLLKQSLDASTQSVYDQGEKLGISKTRMDELVQATANGTFTTSMLTGTETQLAGSLTDLAQKQDHTREVSEKLEEAQKKLLKAQTDLAIAQDIEAGNFELAAARIEVAEAQQVYSTDEATKQRIAIFKKGSDEERKNLLQDLTPEQRTRMMQYNGVTKQETAKLNKIWEDSSEATRNALLDGVDDKTLNEFDSRLYSVDNILAQHSSVWSKIGDIIKEIFSFGHATTATYNGNSYAKQYIQDEINKVQNDWSLTEEEKQRRIKSLKQSMASFAVGTNYVPSDGLAYLHEGEAVIPKKYNQPYNAGISNEERSYMQRMISTINSLDNTIKQGIPVSGQFVQRGSDLVAVVNKTKSQTGADLLSNVAYAR